MATSSIIQRILVIGATGMLGRPVVRRLIEDGFAVRGMARDVERATAVLPAQCQIVKGDVRDESRLLNAIHGCDAVYINLAEPMVRKKPQWDPEVDGTRAVISAMRAGGVNRVIRISAMGVDDAADTIGPSPRGWWAATAKRDADDVVMQSSRDWTVFRPTWFMESLCTMRLGKSKRMVCPNQPRSPLRWIAGDDYARQVSAALRSRAAINRVYQPQGPELLTISQAMERFVAALKKEQLRIMPMSITMARLMKPFNGRLHYLVSLLNMTRDHFARIDRQAIATDLPAATMTVEDYARYVDRTNDWPRK